jgi:CheY-like chemotaxis protein
LVVDDEPALRASLRTLLSDHYEVHTVGGAAEALELLAREGNFDMVLCDVMMPGSTGIEVLAEIEKQHAELKDRVVFMTGGTIGERAKQFLETPGIRQLKKPFPLEELHRLFDELGGEDE